MTVRTMRPVRRLLVVGSIVALVASATASANHLDPRKNIRPADQARARAMLLKTADVGPGYTVNRSPSPEVEIDCAGLDESDLTLTGEAESPSFTRGLAFLSSNAQVYESTGDATASWRRGTGAAGSKCIQATLRREFALQGARLTSFKKVAFPRVAAATAAYRVVVVAQSQGVEVTVFVDLVVLLQSRAQAALFFGSGLAPTPRAEELRLARLTGKRMTAAMRGS